METRPLWHYTCDHAVEAIQRDGFLRPHQGVVWLTDLYRVRRKALGLTSTLLGCDRTAHRFRVTDAGMCLPWAKARRIVGEGFAAMLEAVPGVELVHWWVAFEPVPVKLAEAGR